MQISVVIPVKNRPVTLRRAIDSVLRQTVAPIEIIIVDDGSTDDTPAVISQLATQYPHIRSARHETSRGAPIARNRGAEMAVGDAIAFLDSDDAWKPSKLAIQVDMLQNAPDVPAVFSNVEYHYGTATKRRGFIPGVVTRNDLMGRNVLGGTSSVLVRKESFVAVGGFTPDMPSCQDWDLWLRLAAIGPLNVSAEVLVEYHFDGGQRLSKNRAGVEKGHANIFSMVNRDIADPDELRQVKARQARRMAEVYARQFNDLPSSAKALWSAVQSDASLSSLTATARTLLKSVAVIALRRA